MKKKIIVTGGSGRFGSYLKRVKTQHKFFFPTKKQLNILSENSIIRYLKKTKGNILIHLAGLSRPMEIHKKDINKSIDLNIVGTANITKVCSKLNVKLIYFSTTMFIQVSVEIILKKTHFYLSIIMLGQN